MPPAAGEAQRGIRNDHVSLLTALEGDSCGTKPVATPRIHGRYGTALIRRPIAFGNRLFRPAFVALRDHLNRIDLRGVRNLLAVCVSRASREDKQRLLVAPAESDADNRPRRWY
jgi:hypothetical protein